MKKVTCFATAARARYEEAHKNDKVKPGTTLRPEPKMIDDRDPIELRESYYRAMAARKEDSLAS